MIESATSFAGDFASENPKQSSSRIVVVDDHSVVRELLKFRLSRIEDRNYDVVGESGTGQSAVEVCLKVRPDLLLLDLILPGLNGCDVMRRLMIDLPMLRVLFFSGATRLSLISEAIQLGAAGFVSKLRPWQTVLDAVNLVADGGRYFDPAVAHLVMQPPVQSEWQTLTPREREVVQLIAESRTTKEIAQLLGISVKTADKHRTRMMEKLHLHDSAAVTRFAIQAGLISVD